MPRCGRCSRLTQLESVQGDGVLVAGGDEDGRHRAMVIGFVAAFMLQTRTAGTVDFVRGVIPSAVQREQEGVLEDAPAFQVSGLAQALQGRIIAGKKLFRWDGIEHLPDVIVRRDFFQMEEALGITLSLGLLHGLLVGQEGRTLGEEDGKSA